MGTWVYPHQNFDEPAFADGSPILRPVVPLILSPDRPAAIDVLGSGSPLSVADADLFSWLDMDVEADTPLYELDRWSIRHHPRVRSRGGAAATGGR